MYSNPITDRLAVTIVTGYIFKNVSDLIYAIAEGTCTRLYFRDGSKFIVSKSLKVVQEQLPSDDFIRIHASHLVNKAHLVYFEIGEENMVTLSNGEELAVSRRNKIELYNSVIKL